MRLLTLAGGKWMTSRNNYTFSKKVNNYNLKLKKVTL